MLEGLDVREAFSRDASLIQRQPLGVVYARNLEDVCKTLRFLGYVAGKGKTIPLTVRGGGSDLSGAAVGPGLILQMPAYLNRILRSQTGRGVYCFEAGLNVAAIKTTLAEQSDFLPPLEGLPATATIGGAIANNASSRYSTKYGLMADSLESLKVVLANGEPVEVESLSWRQILKKQTLDTFEGDIYRAFIKLFFHEDSAYYYKKDSLFFNTDKERVSSVYNLSQVVGRDKSLNLVPFFAGSQGTLGVITEATVRAVSYNKQPKVVLLQCATLKSAVQFVHEMRRLKPATLSFINMECLEAVKALSPHLVRDFKFLKKAELLLIVEFDNLSARQLFKKARTAELVAKDLGVFCESIKRDDTQMKAERLRSALGLIVAENAQRSDHLYSGFADAFIPLDHFASFYAQAKLFFKGYSLPLLAFGEISCGRFSVLPKFNLQTDYHRQRFSKFLEAYYELVLKHKGALSLSQQEGALLGQLLESSLNIESYQLMREIKTIFDPYGILNPQIKLGAVADDVKQRLKNPDWQHFYRQAIRLD